MTLRLLLASILALSCAAANAQTQTSCASIGQDADGDGYGWVVNPAVGEQPHSCIVDENTQPSPAIINRETNQPVELVRAYWDANTDIAGKTLECEEFQWSELPAAKRKAMDLRMDQIKSNIPPGWQNNGRRDAVVDSYRWST